jgi:membrane-associated phospholipid phosphatase
MVALLFWFRDRRYFKRYTTGMVILSYASFLTYFLYPAMPPWMAAEQGYIPSIHRITFQVMQNAGLRLSLPILFNYYNPTAAVPSLHAAYPLISALFLVRRFPRIGVPFFLYPLFMWLSLVYLGEHYVFDILLGALYAIVAYVAVEHGNSLWMALRMRLRSSAAA